MAEKEKNERKDQETSPTLDRQKAADNNPCALCRGLRLPPPCKGHGGGGGGGDEDDRDEDLSVDTGIEEPLSAADSTSNSKSEKISAANLKSPRESRPSPKLAPVSQHVFDTQVISKLIANGLLEINNDPDSGTLSIKLSEPHLLDDNEWQHLTNYLKNIVEEFEAFKETHDNVTDSCLSLKADDKGNIRSLKINMPNPALYDAFIQQLDNKSLLPSRAYDPKNESADLFNPGPLSMEAKPSDKRKDDEEPSTSFNPQPKPPIDPS